MFYKYQIKYWNWKYSTKLLARKNKRLINTCCCYQNRQNIFYRLGKKGLYSGICTKSSGKSTRLYIFWKKNSCGKWNIILWEVTHYLLLKEIKILFKKPLEERKNHNMIYVHIFCIILFLCVYVNSFGYLKILLRRLH